MVPAHDPPDDAMVDIARIVSPPEAMVLASRLDAAGIVCHVGGWRHHGVEINSLALGGFAVRVPSSQHAPASALIRDYLAQPVSAEAFCAQRRRILRLIALIALLFSVPGVAIALVFKSQAMAANVFGFAAFPLFMPVPPAGRGSYSLRSEPPA